MVGVAGRSKGCATCRRRKIGCDLGRPTCQQCLKSNRECEGYDRYPVFIVHTVKGVQKRKLLEEAKPRAVQKSPSPDHLSMQYHKGSTSSSPAGAMPTAGDSIVSFRSATLEGSLFLSFAYELYGSSADAKNKLTHMPIIDWLKTIMTEASADPALDPAMLAISVRMCALRGGDVRMLSKANQLYTTALGALQNSLSGKESAMRDETLAATCIMALYELTDPERADPDAWLSHIGGIAILLKARGPSRHRLPLARASFEHCRYILMLHCLYKRNSLGFAEHRWMDDPWATGGERSMVQRVVDQGFRLAAILEQIDDSARWPQGIHDAQRLVRYCDEAIQHIGLLKQELRVQEGWSPLLDTDDPNSSDKPLGEDVTNCLLLRLTASAIELSLQEAASEAFRKAREIVLDSAALNDDNDDTDERDLISYQLQLIEAEVPPQSHRLVLAQEIVDESKLVFRGFDGSAMMMRLMFPLDAAAKQLKYQPRCPQYRECNELMQGLQGRGGVGAPRQHPEQRTYTYMGKAMQRSVGAISVLQRRQ